MELDGGCSPESVPGFYLDQMSGHTRHQEMAWGRKRQGRSMLQCGAESQEQLLLVSPEEFNSENNNPPTLLNSHFFRHLFFADRSAM